MLQWPGDFSVNFDESVRYMSGLRQFGPRNGRARFLTLLKRLGSPQERFRCIHVAGTNGKGSTTTFIASILRTAGYRVGAYLSPYVFDLRERVQTDETLIPREEFARHITEIRPHIETLAGTELGQTTEFELKTAVAFRHFAERQVDFAVVEVGIGGLLDATNVIPPPLVAVITSIGRDHIPLLGNTLAEIAFQKAGILKRGTLACVTAVPPGEALAVIAARAADEGIPLLRAAPPAEADPGAGDGAFVTYRLAPDGFLSLSLPDRTLENLRLTLRGPFQAANAAAALGAAETLRRHEAAKLDDAVLRAGLERASLPGRFQITRPGDPALALDVAHNEDGAQVLREALRATFGDKRRFTFVVGTSKGHDPEPFLHQLQPLLHRVIATAPPFRPLPAPEVAEAARRLGASVEVVEPASDAITHAWRRAQPGEVVVVTGSFYTVGETPEDLRGGLSGGG
jgi:dihydrofolate synthase / folylpolyglutamate synthase